MLPSAVVEQFSRWKNNHALLLMAIHLVSSTLDLGRGD